MAKYLYVLTVDKPFSETELGSVKEEICRVFDCTEITISGASSFTLHSPLGPEKLSDALRDLSSRFRVEFRAGGKIN